MPKRKTWSEEQDKVLLYLKEKSGEAKWTHIANTMRRQFSLPGRTGKQCRERYINHLNAHIVNSKWTRQEQQTLIQLHSTMGNKWTIIAKQLPGRSDNCIKNFFYSKVRKSVRRLNKLVIKRQMTDYKTISSNHLTKILQIAEEKFKSQSTKFDITAINECTIIKELLLKFDRGLFIENDALKQECPLDRLLHLLQKYSTIFDTSEQNKLLQAGQPSFTSPEKTQVQENVKKEEDESMSYRFIMENP